ncbi:hypothetical protein [Streptomyces thermolilacinus]|uniref:hypothetical protein n=1 Tax=Streptomyces thermolilacinus TaxID=285540 RepID=UPI0033DEBAD9
MLWKRESDGFGEFAKDVKRELAELHARVQRLDDERVGLTALHDGIMQSRLKIQEVVQTGVTGLREENREVRRRQDRMINDLHETRGELRGLLELADTLRALHRSSPAGRERADEKGSEPEHLPSERLPLAALEPPTDSWSVASDEPGPDLKFTADTPHHTKPDALQGETMENTDPHPATAHQDQGRDDLALKKAIEAAYRGEDVPVPAKPAVPPASTTRSTDPVVAHGVLLLKAAGVASAELTAHRDHWEWLTTLVVDHAHFRTPPAVEDVKEGRVRTVLSGRSLIAVLIKLWETRANARPMEEDWAMATTFYDRIAAKLANVTGGGETIRIVLDDGAPHSPLDD